MAPPFPPVVNDCLIILYASQTGNAMDVAQRVGREAKCGGCLDVGVLSMDSFNPFPAKKLDHRLFNLGAKPIIEKGLGDDQHDLGYEAALDPWLQSLWKSLNETNPSLLPRPTDSIHPNLDILEDTEVEIMYLSPQDANISDTKRLIERARSMSPALKFYNDGEPHYMLQMAISYQVGDTLEILPCQNPSDIDDFIKRCNLDPDSYITTIIEMEEEAETGQEANTTLHVSIT